MKITLLEMFKTNGADWEFQPQKGRNQQRRRPCTPLSPKSVYRSTQSMKTHMIFIKHEDELK